MKVLFVYSGYENLGVEYLSATLREAGHETALAFDPRLFDDHYTRAPLLARLLDRRQATLARAERERPDLLAFSVVTEDYTWACEVADQLKRRLGVPVVFGGVHVSSVPHRVMEEPVVDYAVVGEGERALVALADRLELGRPVDDVPNLCFRRDGRVVQNDLAPLMEDLDALPLPHKELFYDQLPYLRRDYMTMTSRGCPNRCTYCFNDSMRRLYRGKGRYVRRRSVDAVLAELVRALATWPKLERVQFYDDVFTTDRAWLEQLAPRYRDHVALPFWCSVNPRFVDRDVVRLLADMGCWEVQMGVQTINRRLRQEVLRRPEDVDQVRQAVELFRAAGVKVVLDNISGVPGETEAEVLESLSFYNSVRPSRISDYYMRYYPATEVIDLALAAGALDPAAVDELERGRGSESFALGGTAGVTPSQRRLHFLLAVLLQLPPGLNSLIISRGLYRFLPRHDGLARILIRLVDVLRREDINAERYWAKYLHFLTFGAAP